MSAAFALAGWLLLTFCLAIGHAGSGPGPAPLRYVASTGADGSNLCMDRALPCATVQHAVDVAAPGDEIRIAAGVYRELHARPAPAGYLGSQVITQVVFLSKTLTLRGGYTTTDWTAADPDRLRTVLDAGGRGRGLFMGTANGEPISPTLEGLWIMHGSAAGLGGALFGNDAGGGIGGLGVAPTVRHSRVISNQATWGGGIWLGRGGPCVLEGNQVMTNTAATGGGLFVGQNDATLDANIFRGNVASQQGGGLLLLYGSATLTNNAIIGNRSLGNVSGIGIAGTQARLVHTTIAGNTGGDGSGVTVNELASIPSNVRMINTVLVQQRAGITVGVSSQVQMDGVLWFANEVDHGGLGTITIIHANSGDPHLAADGYHLVFPSAAIDRGTQAGITTDIDGALRPVGPAPDLGAVEYPYHPQYLPLTHR